MGSSRRLPDGWERGITFVSDGCLAPERIGPCAVVAGTPETPGDAALFTPVLIRQGVVCSSMSGFDLEVLADESLAATAEYAVGQELVDGLATNNPNLADATSVGTATSISDALGCLEEAAAVGLGGRPAFIHVPPGATSSLPSSLSSDGSVWRTAAGTTIVSSPGYAGQAFMFATSEVWTGIGAVDTGSALERSNNTDEAWANVIALAAFDPCWTAKVAITLPDCTP